MSNKIEVGSELPLEHENENGLHQKYVVRKVVKNHKYNPLALTHDPSIQPYMEIEQPNAEYFILRLDDNATDKNHLRACKLAVNKYAEEIAPHLPKLAQDIFSRYPLSHLTTHPPVKEEEVTFEQFFERYKSWSHGTFGTDTPIHGLRKLIKEANECMDNPNDIKEYADVLMCHLYAFTCAFPDAKATDLLAAAFDKLRVNEQREWVKQPDGTYQHKK